MTNRISSLKQCSLGLLILCMASTLSYGSIQISVTSSGWYSDSGSHGSANPNYFVRTNGTGNYRNFFVFDLSSVTETIVSAMLKLENPQTLKNGITSTYTLFDVSTSIPTLVASQSGATGIYSDLGTGTSYGSATINNSVSPGFVEIAINNSAIAALNSASGLFALGGAFSAASSTLTEAFSGTSGPQYERTLILEVEQTSTSSDTGVVPEPASSLVWAGIALITGTKLNSTEQL